MDVTAQQVAPVVLHGRGRRMLWPAVSAIGGLAFAAVVHSVDPNVEGHFPTCPWLALTGTWCIGCGTLRATHALTHGDLAGGLARNPLTVITSAVLMAAWMRWASRQWRGLPRVLLAPAWSLYALFWLLMAYWVLRNVPGWTWLSPE